MQVVQSNLAIRNFLVALKLFLNAKCSLSLLSKWQIGHGKWFLNTNKFLIKPFLIAKFDCTNKQTMFVRKYLYILKSLKIRNSMTKTKEFLRRAGQKRPKKFLLHKLNIYVCISFSRALVPRSSSRKTFKNRPFWKTSSVVQGPGSPWVGFFYETDWLTWLRLWVLSQAEKIFITMLTNWSDIFTASEPPKFRGSPNIFLTKFCLVFFKLLKTSFNWEFFLWSKVNGSKG